MEKTCYSCLFRTRVSDREICKRKKKVIKVSRESGHECRDYEKRLPIMCHLYYFAKKICSFKECKPNDCLMFIN